MKFSNGGPELGRYITLLATDNCPPKFKELVLWDGEAGCGAEIAKVFPDEEILEGRVPIRAWQSERDESFVAIDHENVTVFPIIERVVMEGEVAVGDKEW